MPTATRWRRCCSPTGFFRAKTNSVINLSAAIVERFGGEVPGRLEDLVTLPGRRPQDRERRARQRVRRPRHHRRHPRRAARAPVRLDRARPTPSRSSTPIGALFPRRDWTMLSHVLIFHGRRTCHAKQAGLRRLPGRAVVPGLRRGRDRPRQGPRRLLAYELAPGALLPGPAARPPARRPAGRARDRLDPSVARRSCRTHRRRRPRVVRHLRPARGRTGAAPPCSCSSGPTRAAARTSCSPSAPTPCARTPGRSPFPGGRVDPE